MLRNNYLCVFCIALLSLVVVPTTFSQQESDVERVNKSSVSQFEKSFFEFDNGWWRLNKSGQKEVRVSQCGFYSTLFVLEYFEISFNSILVSENLPASEAGVALDTIQKLLQAHGLKTTGRKNVTFADLKRIPRSAVAIVAIPNVQDTAHYYVVAPTKRGVTLVDTPFGVALFDEIAPPTLKDLDERLASQGGIVLFAQVNDAKNVSKITGSVSVSPTEQNLGEFLIDVDPSTVEPFRPQFELQNTSATPVAVEIQTSCGCVGKTNWKTKIIDAKAKETLEFEVSPRSWINGKKTEIILLKFPDSSLKFISITGTGHGGGGSATMKLDDPSALVFDIGSNDARNFSKTLSKNILLPIKNEDVLSVKTNISWLKAKIVDRKSITENKEIPTETIIKSVECEANVTNSEIESLCENDNSLYGKVTVTGEPGGKQVQFDVILRRDPLVSASPHNFFLVKDQKGTIKIQSCDNIDSPIKEVKVRRNKDENDSLICNLQRINETSCQAEISFFSEPDSKHQLIRFDVEFENGMCDSTTILASLKNDEK